MLLLKRVVLVVVTLLMLAIYATPLDAYIPEVERQLSSQIREPVRVGGIRLGLFPVPHLELANVRVGTKGDVSAHTIGIEVQLAALLRGELLLHRVDITGGVVHWNVARLWTERIARMPSKLLQVREVQFHDMTVLFDTVTLQGMEGKVELAEGSHVQRIWLAMDGQRVVFTAQTRVQGLGFALHARDWQPPVFTRLPMIEGLEVDGEWNNDVIDFKLFKLTSVGLQAEGLGQLNMGALAVIDAELKEADVSLPLLFNWLSQPGDSSGILQMHGNVRSSGSSLAELRQNLSFSGVVALRQAEVSLVKETAHPFAVDVSGANVMVEKDRLRVSDINAMLYDGLVTGELMLDRQTLTLTGHGVVRDVNLQPLIGALSREVALSGHLDAQNHFSMQLREFEKFPANAKLQSVFQLRNGILQKIDLEQVAKQPGKQYANSGMTRFDQLKGSLSIDERGYHFRQLALSSGAIDAEGDLDIAPNLTLNGTLDADVKGTVGLVSMPMVVGGTLDKPSVTPSGSALAGAAVGTAILGPGLGTALGVKVGGFLHKLFGASGLESQRKNGEVGKIEKHAKP